MTVPPADVTVLPAASMTVTCGCVGKVAPAPAVADGVTANCSAAAAPGASVTVPLVTGESPAAAAPIVYDPTLSSVTPANVATPATAATEIVPPMAPAAGPVALVSETVLVAVVTRLPAASRISMTAGKAISDVALAGGAVWKASTDATPGPMLNGVESTPVRPAEAAARR